jgi:hypothetical protein
MELKKGVYFTIDSLIAAGIVFTVILLSSSFYAEEQPSFHLNYMSQDLVRTLSTLTVEEANNEYLDGLMGGPNEPNLKNTILEQVGGYWADDKIINANRTVSNVTEPFIPDIIGFGIWINNKTIYKRDIPIQKSLVSSKKILSGVSEGQTGPHTRGNLPALGTPVIVEVRLWE